jgi:hypothetical protein
VRRVQRVGDHLPHGRVVGLAEMTADADWDHRVEQIAAEASRLILLAFTADT